MKAPAAKIPAAAPGTAPRRPGGRPPPPAATTGFVPNGRGAGSPRSVGAGVIDDVARPIPADGARTGGGVFRDEARGRSALAPQRQLAGVLPTPLQPHEP